MEITEERLHRYARHIIMDEVGEEGQIKLLESRVLVIGAGGLGSPVLMYLAAAGVGTLGVIDDDVVDITNLQRQIAHTTGRVGTSKVDSATETIAAPQPRDQGRGLQGAADPSERPRHYRRVRSGGRRQR